MLLLFCLIGFAAMCTSSELTPAEKDFYKRANRFHVGDRIAQAEQVLGRPSRIVEASTECREHKGEKEWVYETIELPTGKTRLGGGSVLFCVDRHGTIKAGFHVHH